jgi:hypothetical protein
MTAGVHAKERRAHWCLEGTNRTDVLIVKKKMDESSSHTQGGKSNMHSI